MEIIGDTIHFKSNTEYYFTERDGKKPNTLRALDGIQRSNLMDWVLSTDNAKICIHRIGTYDTFTRKLVDVALPNMYTFQDGRLPVIFSWKHPDPSDEILSRAITHYGEPAQVLKCIEELAELGSELTTTIYSENNGEQAALDSINYQLCGIADMCKNTIKNLKTEEDCICHKSITSELADVSITTSQMLKIFSNREEFEKVKQAKLTRLADRINGGDSQ